MPPRRLLISLHTGLLVAGIVGCNAPPQQDTPAMRQEVVDAIRAQVPGVTVEAVESQQSVVAGVRGEPGLYVRVLGAAANPDQARARTRSIAKAVWFAAPHRLTAIQVEHRIPLRAGGPCTTTRSGESTPPDCWADNLSLPTDAAKALWGPAPGRDRPASSSGQACAKSARAVVPDLDAISADVRFSGTSFGGSNVAVEATLPAMPASPDQQAELAARFAGFVWRCHPGKLDSVEVRLESSDASGKIVGFPHDAAELLERFGSRPDDLPQ